jgi:hypothetical protein
VIPVAETAGGIIAEAGAVAGGGAVLGATAGFIGWLLYEPILRAVHHVPGAKDRLSAFVTAGGGLGGVAGFLVWLLEEYGLL